MAELGFAVEVEVEPHAANNIAAAAPTARTEVAFGLDFLSIVPVPLSTSQRRSTKPTITRVM